MPDSTLQPIVDVSVAGDMVLQVVWKDGTRYRVDLSTLIRESQVLAPLRAKDMFDQVSVGLGGYSLDWPGDLELGSDQVFRWGAEQAGDFMPSAEFVTWRGGMGLTQEKAAAALGLSKRMIAYYESGEKPIPKTVRLACIGLEALGARHGGEPGGSVRGGVS